jgi:hypothetical protein
MYGYDPAQWRQDEQSDRNFRNLSILGTQIGGAIDDTADRVRTRQAERAEAQSSIARKQELAQAIGMPATTADVATAGEADRAKPSALRQWWDKITSDSDEEKKDGVVDVAKGTLTAIASKPGTSDEKAAEVEQKMKPLAFAIQADPKRMSKQEYEQAVVKGVVQSAANFAADPTVTVDQLKAEADKLDGKKMNGSVLRTAAWQKLANEMIAKDPALKGNLLVLKEAGRKVGMTDKDMEASPVFY